MSDEGPMNGTGQVAHTPTECPECFVEVRHDGHWWMARPEGSRLVGLVVARDDMPPILEQRQDLLAFGVAILDFRYPAPENLGESWEQRLARFFGTLHDGDVLVVANVHALGRDLDEEVRTLGELRRRGVVVKVLSHGARHLADTAIEQGAGEPG
ncbi:recombinase family protein [Agromyces sp. NPDC058104]|uniref:recombinase family protein n=1 Tax=Agromyces sp. NPDC058104 TaxID=3346342 RepID=UPI0036DD9B15